MRTVLTNLARFVMGAVVAGSLAFGVFVATAEARSNECPFEPPSHLGACTTPPECQQDCEDVNGNPQNFGFCSTPGEGFCCHCILA